MRVSTHINTTAHTYTHVHMSIHKHTYSPTPVCNIHTIRSRSGAGHKLFPNVFILFTSLPNESIIVVMSKFEMVSPTMVTTPENIQEKIPDLLASLMVKCCDASIVDIVSFKAYRGPQRC